MLTKKKEIYIRQWSSSGERNDAHKNSACRYNKSIKSEFLHILKYNLQGRVMPKAHLPARLDPIKHRQPILINMQMPVKPAPVYILAAVFVCSHFSHSLFLSLNKLRLLPSNFMSRKLRHNCQPKDCV